VIPGDFDASIVRAVAHRPWPMPSRPWIMTQTWHDLLFAHWPIDAREVRARVPAAFDIDTFEGRAWLGIVPFSMTNVSMRGVPALPWLSAFPELNVRTYVRAGRKPGVYFFSLDAGRALAVWAARSLLNLPYHLAAMRVSKDGARIGYDSRRRSIATAALSAIYEPEGDVRVAEPGSLEHFLVERYCLYQVTRRGVPYRLEIHHPPWRLQAARAAITRNTMTSPIAVPLPATTPVLHFSRRQDVVAWRPERLTRPDPSSSARYTESHSS
jgi:uncharacterized protein YqjF (DUF2071 family)